MIPVVLQGMCRSSPDGFHPSCTSPKYLCACVLLHLLTVCCVHATTINTPFHESPHLTSRSVPMQRGSQLTFLSSWQIMTLPSLPRVHLGLPLLPQSGPARLAEHLDQATPACSGTQLPGSQRRSPRAAFFFFIPSSKQPLPVKAFFCVCVMKSKED